MEKQDPRTFTPEAQEQLRQQAVRLYQKGMTYKKIAEIIGAHRNSVSIWCRNYESKGITAIRSRKRGRGLGMNRILTKRQEAEIQQCIVDKMPDQYKLTFALWTRKAIIELIRVRFGITIPVRTMGHYLKRWGYTPQKPLKRAYEQRPEAVKKWVEEEYPSIRERATNEDAEIHWGDETGVRSDCQHGRSYSPRGKTPVIRLSAKYTSVNMISTVTNQGKVRFMLYDTTLNAQKFIEFLKRLCKDSERKVFLILDNLRVHHAKIVKEWLMEHTAEIELFYLPSYSPELNPDEYLNGDLKAGVHSKPPIRNRDALKKSIISHMMKLQKCPSRVASYFKHPSIRYAA
jgi:transposase